LKNENIPNSSFFAFCKISAYGVYPPNLGLLVFPFQGTKKDGSYFSDKNRLIPLFYFADIFQECPKIKGFSLPDLSGLSG
jgi:hypothetical protein